VGNSPTHPPDPLQTSDGFNCQVRSGRLGWKISTFEHLTDDEIGQGLAWLAADAAAEISPRPVHHVHDLLTLQKRQ
jgi:hypothetical protein